MAKLGWNTPEAAGSAANRRGGLQERRGASQEHIPAFHDRSPALQPAGLGFQPAGWAFHVANGVFQGPGGVFQIPGGVSQIPRGVLHLREWTFHEPTAASQTGGAPARNLAAVFQEHRALGQAPATGWGALSGSAAEKKGIVAEADRVPARAHWQAPAQAARLRG